jgi:hypothetical protein
MVIVPPYPLDLVILLEMVMTDKLPAYERAIKKEFYTMKNPRPQHVKLKSIREGTNNNIVEALHGTVRERRKVMRELDNDKTAAAMPEGNRIYTTTV